MTSKQKLSPNGTFIFDEADLAQLDELSFTTVIDEAAGPANLTAAAEQRSGQVQPGQAPSEKDEAPPGRQGDAEINALLDCLDTGLK